MKQLLQNRREGEMKIPVIGALGLVAIIAVAAVFVFPGLKISEDWATRIWPLLGSFFVISLFLERSIEVFLSAFRAGDADRLDLKTKMKKKELDKIDKDTDQTRWSKVTEELGALKGERAEYRIRSRQWALWGGLAMGVFVALVGFHGLESLVDPEYFKELGLTLHLRLFHGVDVLVTGAVLAGGSDAVNKIMKLYSAFTETAAENARAKKHRGDAS
jgi:hypothetical protein